MVVPLLEMTLVQDQLEHPDQVVGLDPHTEWVVVQLDILWKYQHKDHRNIQVLAIEIVLESH